MLNYTKEPFEKECEECHTVFITRNLDKHYCSKNCRVKHNNAKASANKGEKPLVKNCIVCGQEFKPSRSDCKYCSKDCCYIAQKQRRLEREKAERKELLDNLICFSCGKSFESDKYVKRFCPECSKKRNKKSRKKTSGKSISEIALLARKAGLSYGQYVAQNNL